MERFDTTNVGSFHRWSDISVLVSLLICMSSSFSSCRAPPPPSPLSSPRSAVKRRCFPPDQINPRPLRVRSQAPRPPVQAPLLLLPVLLSLRYGRRVIESLPTTAFCRPLVYYHPSPHPLSPCPACFYLHLRRSSFEGEHEILIRKNRRKEKNLGGRLIGRWNRRPAKSNRRVPTRFIPLRSNGDSQASQAWIDAAYSNIYLCWIFFINIAS